MKLALTQDERMVEAGPGAPERAECPHCGGVVDLRHRKDSDTWFWRHRRKPASGCPPKEAVDGAVDAPEGVPVPTEDASPPGRVQADNLAELVEIAQECGAEVRVLEKGDTFECDGPTTLIVARLYVNGNED